MKKLILLTVLCACSLCCVLLAQDQDPTQPGWVQKDPGVSGGSAGLQLPPESDIPPPVKGKDRYESVMSAAPYDGPWIGPATSDGNPGGSSSVLDGGDPIFIPGVGRPVPVSVDPDLIGEIVQQGTPGNNVFPFLQGGYQLWNGDSKGWDTMVSGTLGNIAAWGAAQAFVYVAGGSFFFPEVVIGGTVSWGTQALYGWMKGPDPDANPSPSTQGIANQVGNQIGNRANGPRPIPCTCSGGCK